jgi:hypothetical protein
MEGRFMAQWSEDKLMDFSEHLAYEIWMFFETACKLADFDAQNATSFAFGTVERNALLESFLIHTRILIDFLYKHRSGYSNDVFAKDFVEDGETWKNRYPEASQFFVSTKNGSQTLDEIKHEIDERVAHLTSGRLGLTEEEKGWTYSEIANEIKKVLKEFLDLVPTFRVSDSFRDRSQEAIAHWESTSSSLESDFLRAHTK